MNGVGTGMADDHMNVAVASDGTLYAAVKARYDTGGYPRMALLVRRPVGAGTTYTAWMSPAHARSRSSTKPTAS